MLPSPSRFGFVPICSAAGPYLEMLPNLDVIACENLDKASSSVLRGLPPLEHIILHIHLSKYLVTARPKRDRSTHN
jgi:hypothetical protein